MKLGCKVYSGDIVTLGDANQRARHNANADASGELSNEKGDIPSCPK